MSNRRVARALTDERSRKEYEVYQRLAEDHRRGGLLLETIATTLQGRLDQDQQMLGAMEVGSH